jgi:hypothetical protein
MEFVNKLCRAPVALIPCLYRPRGGPYYLLELRGWMRGGNNLSDEATPTPLPVLPCLS